MLHHLEWMHAQHLTIRRIGLRLQCDKFQAHSVVQALLVNDITDLVADTGLAAIVQHAIFLADHMDGIPTLCNSLFPQRDLLGQAIVVGRKLLEAGSFIV